MIAADVKNPFKAENPFAPKVITSTHEAELNPDQQHHSKKRTQEEIAEYLEEQSIWTRIKRLWKNKK